MIMIYRYLLAVVTNLVLLLPPVLAHYTKRPGIVRPQISVYVLSMTALGFFML